MHGHVLAGKSGKPGRLSDQTSSLMDGRFNAVSNSSDSATFREYSLLARESRPSSAMRQWTASASLARRPASGEIRTTRHAPFDATEHRPPIAILDRFQWEPQIRQRMASDDTVLIGLD